MAFTPQQQQRRDPIIQLERTKDERNRTHYKMKEPRGKHFRNTLFLAGALSMLAIGIYVFVQASSAVQATGIPVAQPASAAR